MKILILFTFTLTTIFAGELDFNHDGWDREAYYYKPSCLDDAGDDFEPIPLVFMIHGLGGVGEDYYGLSLLAEDSCFIAVFPSGMFNTWNAGPDMPYAHDIDDNSYFDALIDTIDIMYPIDTNRVYLTGHSMGGAMASHMNCTSTSFTAYGGSGGIINPGYHPGNEHEDLCKIENGTYPNPMIITHGLNDATVPYEWAIFNLYHFQLLNRCQGTDPWPYDYSWPGLQSTGDYWEDPEDDLEDITNSVLSNADTIQYDGIIQRYQWSQGCLGGSSSLEAIFLPNLGHAWFQTWNSPISTSLEHWNFLRQFSKDKMGPVLDSLSLPASETLDNDYYINGETTPIGILAIDNYSVASVTISFSGFVNVGGFDLTLTIDTNERLLYGEVGAVLDADISTDNYETVQVVVTDHDGNEKVYDFEALQELGFYQQMAVVNNITTSTDNEILAPEVFTLHQNYPNPFNPETNISYDIPEDGFVSVNVYDMRGTLIKTLVNDVQSSGYRTLKWNGTNDKGQKVSAGLYLYRIEAEGFTDTKKMALIK